MTFPRDWDREMEIYRKSPFFNKPAMEVAKDALVDIANDCGSLEAAQRRAKDALEELKRRKL